MPSQHRRKEAPRARGESQPRFVTGGKLILLKLKVGLSIGRYIAGRRRSAVVVRSFLEMLRSRRDLDIRKAVGFGGGYYFAILRNPRWPSPAFDRMLARRGIDGHARDSQSKVPTDSVFLGFSRECAYACEHCYERHNLGRDGAVPLARWKDVVRELQDLGVSVIILSGGEPMLRFEELLELLASGNKDISEFHLHSSGHGITLEKARRLKAAGLSAAGIGLEDPDRRRHDRFRGYNGAFREAVEALRNLNEAGIFTYTNMVLKKEVLRDGGLRRYLDLIKELECGGVLFLEAKPCGAYLFGEGRERLTDAERTLATEFFLNANRSRKYRNHPLIHYYEYYEKPERFGCLMGGLSHFYIDSGGNVEPCVYMPVSFGNILKENLIEIYLRMRKAVPRPLTGGCPSDRLNARIRFRSKADASLPLPYSEIEGDWHEICEGRG